MIRTFFLKDERHWTHILYWNMQRLFEWPKHPCWEIRGTGLTDYVGTCKGCLSDQDIPSEKSQALDSHAMLEHAKVVWVIRTSLLRNHRHWTHTLCWNIQRLLEWSGHLFWEITGTRPTNYVRTCKGCLSDQDIPSDKSEALDLHTMLKHAKVAWVIRTSLLINQRHWTYILCWIIQKLFEWSGHPSQEIRGTGLTAYVGTCKSYVSDQDISSEKSEALDSHAILEHAKVVWVIRTFLLRNQRHWTHMLCWNMQWFFLSDQNIRPENITGLDSHAMLEDAMVIWVIRTSLLRTSQALDLHTMLEHAKVAWVIRTSLLINQRHWTYILC